MTPTPAPKPVPKTGDGGNPVLWIILAALGLIGIGAVVFVKHKNRK